jgi:predicted SnoaL-like aldol condensation-catalyzing enzyme
VRSALAAILTVAVMTTGSLVALDLAQVLGSDSYVAAPDSSGIVSPSDLRLIRQFYDAANALLAGNSPRTLTSVVSPRIETHLANGTPASGPDAVAQHLSALQSQGDLRLSVNAVVRDDRKITALVEGHTVAAADRESLDGPLWQTIDRFRIEDGVIAEYWPGAVASRPLPPPPAVTVPIPPENTSLALARLEFAPGAILRPLVVPATQLQMVEQGTLFVSGYQSLAIARAGDPRFTWLPAAEPTELLLGPGDALLVPARAAPELTNHGDQPASIFSLLIAPNPALFGPKHNLSQDMLTTVAMHDPARIGRRTAWGSGVTSETLAAGNLSTTTRKLEALEIIGRQRSLDPGQRFQPPASTALTFGIVSSGTLHSEITPSPGSPFATPLASDGTDAAARILRAGGAFAIAPDSRSTLTNIGATQLDLMLIEMREARDAASPAPG